jgi:uncharacterized membrane protein YsdA (DUF1294 family)
MVLIHGKTKKGDFSLPFTIILALRLLCLLLIVQFDGVTGVYIFEREDNHG